MGVMVGLIAAIVVAAVPAAVSAAAERAPDPTPARAVAGADRLRSAPAPTRGQAAPTRGQPAPGPDRAFRSRPGLARAAPSGTITRRKLRRRLNKLAGKAPGPSGFYVYDTGAAKKRVLFARSEGTRRRLASNQKLFTTATALHRLGAEERIETRAFAQGSVNGNGRLSGNLILLGGGDPSLGKTGMRSLAKQIKQAGIRRIGGDLVADASVFDERRGVPDSDYGPSPYIAPLSGLTYGGSTYSGDPALDAAEALKTRLRGRGVKLSGRVRTGKLPGKLRGSEPLAATTSPTIAALAADTNKPSNNFYAEMLLKRLWAEAGRKGTTRGGAKAVERFARQQGSGVDARDGSGLTDANRASPRAVVRLLVAMREHRAARAFYDSLPIAGREGTLDERMEGTAAAGRCRAKTGTIELVSTLSGYCNAGHGKKVAFSLLIGGVTNYTAAREIQDRMTIEIARFRP